MDLKVVLPEGEKDFGNKAKYLLMVPEVSSARFLEMTL